MSQKIGKIDLKTFEMFIRRRLGQQDKKVLVPPLTGVDAAVIEIDDEKVIIVAEDPIFSIPGQPLEMFGWYTVHIGASDVAVMGVKPRYLTYTLLMPPETLDRDFRRIVDSIHRSALELELTIVGGHTGYYPGFAAPTVGGITVFAIAKKGCYITPAGARPGDKIILTKGPAIEAAGILSVLREEELLARYPKKLVRRAQALCHQMTVVKDALVAMKAGGVTAMHDATEGGVIGGLFEIAAASGVGMEVEESDIIFPPEVEMVCEAFKLDPLAAIAEGSLLITVSPEASKRVIKALNKEGIAASAIGEITSNKKRRVIRRRHGSLEPLAIPEQDPFWPAFFAGLK